MDYAGKGGHQQDEAGAVTLSLIIIFPPLLPNHAAAQPRWDGASRISHHLPHLPPHASQTLSQTHLLIFTEDPLWTGL